MSGQLLNSTQRIDKICGVLVGTAMGDSLGLPAENLAPARIAARWGNPATWRQRFWFGYGAVSDDTEHTMIVATSLLEAGVNEERFLRVLGRKFRWWFAALPAGVGWATMRACCRLWIGISPTRSGVFSAGNGPALRSALFGVLGLTSELRHMLVAASTRMTHSDPQALWAALAIAEVADLECSDSCASDATIVATIAQISQDAQWQTVCRHLTYHLECGSSAHTFAAALGLARGVTGYALHSVPVALFCWLRYRPNPEQAMSSALQLGGDTDSVGAMVGALTGAALGRAGLPAHWLKIADWPVSLAALDRVGAELGNSDLSVPNHRRWHFWPGQVGRNLVFLAVVLLHLVRRLWPL